MENKIAAVLLDCGDTLVDEGTEIKDANGATLEADLIPGAANMVHKIKRLGYRIALVADGPSATFQNVLTQHNLHHLFDAFSISGEVGVDKPNQRMFVDAMNQLGINRTNYNRVLMVGNNLERDIRGANALGIISVWLNWSPRRSKIPADDLEIPQHTIEYPLDLIPLIESLESQPHPQKQIEIVCHRGANEYAPENTFAAAEICVGWGVDYLEVDVNTSKDGVLYNFHGPELESTTNGKGKIHHLLSDEIDQLDAGSWFDSEFSHQKVPRLEKLLKWIKGKAKVFFDVKVADPKKLIDLVYDVGLENECFFWSANDEWLKTMHQLDPSLPIKINVKTADEAIDGHKIYGASIMEVSLNNITQDLIETCQHNNIKIMIYHQQKDVKAFHEILEWGVEMVNLNHADTFTKLAQNFYNERH